MKNIIDFLDRLYNYEKDLLNIILNDYYFKNLKKKMYEKLHSCIICRKTYNYIIRRRIIRCGNCVEFMDIPATCHTCFLKKCHRSHIGI